MLKTRVLLCVVLHGVLTGQFAVMWLELRSLWYFRSHHHMCPLQGWPPAKDVTAQAVCDYPKACAQAWHQAVPSEPAHAARAAPPGASLGRLR